MLPKNKPSRLMQGIHPIPTMITLGNLLCGFGAILLALRAAGIEESESYACLLWAGRLIFVAMIFDLLDGKVARWTKLTSRFGLEMDSLADMVSFGVAPAVLVKQMTDQQLLKHQMPAALAPYIWAMLAAYVSCAALRLARYNVEAQTGHRSFFFGIPTPGAAGCVAALAILVVPGGPHPQIQVQEPLTYVENIRAGLLNPVLLILPFFMLLLGVLMVSRVHYPHVGDRLLRGRKSFMHLIVLSLALVLVGMHHEIMLAFAFNGYVLFGLCNELRCQIFRAQRPASWDVELPGAPPPPDSPPPIRKDPPL